MNKLEQLVKDPTTVVVDVRSPWEFETQHITGAKNIPLEEIPSRVEEFKAIKSPVVLYCRSGNRSGMAVNILKENGITNVYNGGALEELQFLLN